MARPGTHATMVREYGDADVYARDARKLADQGWSVGHTMHRQPRAGCGRLLTLGLLTLLWPPKPRIVVTYVRVPAGVHPDSMIPAMPSLAPLPIEAGGPLESGGGRAGVLGRFAVVAVGIIVLASALGSLGNNDAPSPSPMPTATGQSLAAPAARTASTTASSAAARPPPSPTPVVAMRTALAAKDVAFTTPVPTLPPAAMQTATAAENVATSPSTVIPRAGGPSSAGAVFAASLTKTAQPTPTATAPARPTATPRPTRTPAPTATPPPGTVENPAPVGTELSDDDVSATLLSAYVAPNYGRSNPRGGYTFLVVELAIENTDSEDHGYADNRLSASDDEIGPEFEDTYPPTDFPLGTGTLSPGEYVSGLIVVEIQETASRVRIRYDTGAFTGDSLFWVVETGL